MQQILKLYQVNMKIQTCFISFVVTFKIDSMKGLNKEKAPNIFCLYLTKYLYVLCKNIIKKPQVN